MEKLVCKSIIHCGGDGGKKLKISKSSLIIFLWSPNFIYSSILWHIYHETMRARKFKVRLVVVMFTLPWVCKCHGHCPHFPILLAVENSPQNISSCHTLMERTMMMTVVVTAIIVAIVIIVLLLRALSLVCSGWFFESGQQFVVKGLTRSLSAHYKL